MKDNRKLPIALGLLLSGAGLFAAVTAKSAPPDTTATAATATATSAPASSATATGSADPSASPSGTASARPLGPLGLPKLKGADIPAEPSEAPKQKDWANGKKVRPTRDQDVFSCEYTLLREWLRIECQRAGATMVAGDPKDVKIIPAGGPLFTSEDGDMQQKVTITLRLVRGESKLFQLIILFGGGYSGISMGDGDIIGVTWREGQEDPVILYGRT